MEQKYSDQAVVAIFIEVDAVNSKTENYLGKTELFSRVSLFYLLRSLSDKPKKLFDMIHIFPDDFYCYQSDAKKCNFSPCLISETDH
jgi:hypothetical protein